MKKEEIFQGAGLDYLFWRLFSVTQKLSILNLEVIKKNGAYDDVFFLRYFSNFRFVRNDYLKNLYSKQGLIDLKFIIQLLSVSDFGFSFLNDNFELNILLTLLQQSLLGLQNKHIGFCSVFNPIIFLMLLWNIMINEFGV